jgi:beta-aspartyl-peptidase (threonine type)
MTPAILVHGGAGPIDGDDAQAAREGCLAAARAGAKVLHAGGSALDAVETAARVLEDDPQFNAGHGAVLTSAGTVELDASIMSGRTLEAGAVASVSTFANPVTLARRVMERSGHVMLVGPGAEAFGRTQGLPTCDPAQLITPRARARFELQRQVRHGTIGAVAIDGTGSVAAATSTGGTTGKLPGRVGDSPLIGCGTYADDALGAASATGVGEFIIRTTLARAVLDRIALGADPFAAAEAACRRLVSLGGDGGVILVTPQGRLAWGFSSERMARAWVAGDAEGAFFARE